MSPPAVLILLTLALPWLGALCVCWVGDGRPRAQHALAAAFALAAALSVLALLPWSSSAVALRLSVGGAFGEITFTADGLGVFLSAIATVIGALCVVFSADYMRGEQQLGRYYAFVLLFVGAMAGLVLTSSLLALFLFWELVALCSYVLISFHNDEPRAVAAGVKALVVTQVGGIGLLAGVLLAYAFLGSYDFATLLGHARSLPPPVLALMAFGFLLAAAAKSAQVPFHTWLPDAMEAPTPVSALIHAATMVNAGVYLLARFYPAFAVVPFWRETVVAVGVSSALLAALLALSATDLKRVLAYSTISQLGLMVYAVGVGALFASQFHLLAHAIFKALLFLAAGALIHTLGTRDLRQLGASGQSMPFVRFVFVLGALALMGVPILNGFWSKELIVEGGAQGPAWALALLLVSVLLTALYSVRVVWSLFFAHGEGDVRTRATPLCMRLALAPLALGVLATWLFVEPLGALLGQTLTLGEMIAAIARAPLTYLTLALIALGAGLWQQRASPWLRFLPARLASPVLARRFAQGIGFEWLNDRVVGVTRSLAAALRTTQTGQLNWNVAGIVGGLLALLAAMAVLQ